MNTEQLKRHIQKSDLTALEKRYLEGLVEAQTPREGMRLIDAEAAKSKAIICTNAAIFGDESEEMITFARTALDLLLMALDDAPTIEAEPVRHSRWLKCDYSSEYYCEECGCAFKIPCYVRGDYEYCPKCSAKMRKENENGKSTSC